MIPLDDIKKWFEKLNDESTFYVFSQQEKDEFLRLPLLERRSLLKDLFEKPADQYIITPWYFWNKWVEALLAVNRQTSHIRLLELASGANTGVPKAMAVAFQHPETSYVTANSNKELTKWFLEGTKDLPIQIKVIEDDAKQIEDYTSNEFFDVVAFEHAVNDIIYNMLAQRAGFDTVHINWFDILPDMIKLTNKEFLNGTLEASVKNELIGIFSACMKVLKKGSYIIINHFMYSYDLDKGINYDFWENLLPIIRRWVNSAGLGREVFIEGFEPQWWMFIEKE